MNKTKKGIVAFLLAAALLVSMVGMASADNYPGPTTWYLTDTTSSVSGADYIMYKDSGVGVGPISMTQGTVKVWASNIESSGSGDSFVAGTWIGWIDFTKNNKLCSGEKIKIEVGYLSGGTFYTQGFEEITGTSSCLEGSPISLPASAFTVSSGNYLATRITMASGNVEIDVDTHVNSDTHIEYPYPELSTLCLFSVGLLTLIGYVGLRRRRNNKLE
jgi:hypothetical protein